MTKSSSKRILVVGSINVDLYQRLDKGGAKFGGKPLSITPIKGMTLPAKNFLETAKVKAEAKKAGLTCKAGGEEALVLTMDGPFDQKTAARAQTPRPPPAGLVRVHWQHGRNLRGRE